MNKTEITVCIDLRKITDPIGHINGNGYRYFGLWDMPQIMDWIDQQLERTNPQSTTVELIWPHAPDWLCMKIGQHLDSKAQHIVISTPRMQRVVIK